MWNHVVHFHYEISNILCLHDARADHLHHAGDDDDHNDAGAGADDDHNDAGADHLDNAGAHHYHHDAGADD